MKHFFHSFILSLFMSAIVLGMASCGGDEPEPAQKDFLFKVEALSTEVHFMIAPTKQKAYFYWSGLIYEEGMEDRLKEIVEKEIQEQSVQSLMDDNAVRDTQLEHIFRHRTPNTTYILYTCYVEDGTDGYAQIVGDVSYVIYKTMPEGTLNGEFTVNKDGKKVHFAQGNLYKDQNEKYNNFEFQWEFSKQASTYPIDLFHWNVTQEFSPNGPWFVLEADEWLYLFCERENAEKRFAHATIIDENGKEIYGLILLPDNWEKPRDSKLTTDYSLNMRWDEGSMSYKSSDSGFDGYAQNRYTIDSWKKLEFAGAVFLPAAYSVTLAYYWSATTIDQANAGMYSFEKFQLYLPFLKRDFWPVDEYGDIRSVRIVD